MDFDTEMQYDNLERVLNEYCAQFKEVYKRNLERDGRKASGNLLNSIELQIQSHGTTIIVLLNVADYYYYVEKGRQAGKRPPFEKILQWIQEKPVIPREGPNGKLPTEKQLAFLISRKIGNEGYEGKPSLQDTIDELNNKYIALLQAALQADFDIYSLKILENIDSMIQI